MTADLPICARSCCPNLVTPPAKPQRIPKIYCSERCGRLASQRRREKRRADERRAARAIETSICLAPGCDNPCSATGARGPVPIFCSRRCSNHVAERDYRNAAKRIERAGFGAAVEIFPNFEILDRDGWQCQLCNVATPREQRGSKLPTAPQVDHKIPIAKGGGHTRENCWCLCFRCNRKKADKILPDLVVPIAGAVIDAGG